MKTLGVLLTYLAQPAGRRNIKVLAALTAALVAMVAGYSAVFHHIMADEGREYSWATSVYWTMTVMSTLGFGDITFHSDAGRLFSIVVLVSGALFVLVLLPFAVIQFIVVPWIEHRASARAPRSLPERTRDHLVLTQLGPIEDALIRRAEQSGVPYVIVEPDLNEALTLHDRGYRVMVGELDAPETYRDARVGHAALVATTRSDTANTNIAFTVQEIDADVPVAATATNSAAVDVLELAGCDRVLQLGEMLGTAMAERVVAADGRSYVVGCFGDVLIAEARAAGTALVGQTLVESAVRSRHGVTVVGSWERGRYHPVDASFVVSAENTLILAGSREQLDRYDAAFAAELHRDRRVVIIGGGRVGRAAARQLQRAGLDPIIVERQADRIRDPDRYVEGDAAEYEVLRRAGIDRASAVLVTTHDDDMNVFLTLYCRRLTGTVQVISRANLERNVSTLHRAGADVVLSYASTGATELWNMLDLNDTLVIAEGLDVFRVDVPTALAGRTLRELALTRRTGCTVVAVVDGGTMRTNPDPDLPLPADADLILIGDAEAERTFLHRYPGVRTRPPRTAGRGEAPRPTPRAPATGVSART